MEGCGPFLKGVSSQHIHEGTEEKHGKLRTHGASVEIRTFRTPDELPLRLSTWLRVWVLCVITFRVGSFTLSSHGNFLCCPADCPSLLLVRILQP